MQEPDPEKRLAFINAWNEWGESAYLEPDRRYGYAYLGATADALRALALPEGDEKRKENMAGVLDTVVKRHNTAIIVHLYYADLWDEICTYLRNLGEAFDLFISIPEHVAVEEADIFREYPNANLFRCPNRGRDIAPFLRILSMLYPLQYKYICKIHTKRTIHREDGEKWRRDMLSKLLGSRKNVAKIKDILDKDDVGIVAPRGHVLPSEFYWGLEEEGAANKANVARLARIADLSPDKLEFLFVGGSMFWFKPSALHPLACIALELDENAFEPERGQKDGTLAHAFERFFGFAASQTGFRIIEIDERGKVHPHRYEELCSELDYPFAVPTKDGQVYRR